MRLNLNFNQTQSWALGGLTADFSVTEIISGPRIKMADVGWFKSDYWPSTPFRMWLAEQRIGKLSFCSMA